MYNVFFFYIIKIKFDLNYKLVHDNKEPVLFLVHLYVLHMLKVQTMIYLVNG